MTTTPKPAMAEDLPERLEAEVLRTVGLDVLHQEAANEIRRLRAALSVQEMAEDQEREAAEQSYANTAFNYPEAPIGSRDWCLFWKGWQARAALAAKPAVMMDEQRAKEALADLELLSEDRAPLEAIVAAGYQHARELRAGAKPADESGSEPVAEVVSSGPANFPLLRWLSADISLNTPIGSKLYTRPAQGAAEGDAMLHHPSTPFKAEFDALYLTLCVRSITVHEIARRCWKAGAALASNVQPKGMEDAQQTVGVDRRDLFDLVRGAYFAGRVTDESDVAGVHGEAFDYADKTLKKFYATPSVQANGSSEKPSWLFALEDRERLHAASGNEIDKHYAAGIRDAMTAYTLAAAPSPAPAAGLCSNCAADGKCMKRQALCVANGTAPAPATAHEPEAVELAAKAVFQQLQGWCGQPWVEGGNSLKQDEARRYASAAMSAVQAPAVQPWTLTSEALPEAGTECVVLVRGADGKLFPALDEWEMQRESPVGWTSHTIETGLVWSGHEFEDVVAWMRVPDYATAFDVPVQKTGEQP